MYVSSHASIDASNIDCEIIDFDQANYVGHTCFGKSQNEELFEKRKQNKTKPPLPPPFSPMSDSFREISHAAPIE